jgi:hypothetical protein
LNSKKIGRGLSYCSDQKKKKEKQKAQGKGTICRSPFVLVIKTLLHKIFCKMFSFVSETVGRLTAMVKAWINRGEHFLLTKMITLRQLAW